MNARILILVRVVVGGLFVYAGVLKIMNPVAFAGSVAAYQILPYFFNYFVAAVLPWLETLCGILLIVGIRMKGAAALLFMLNLVFMGALVSVIARGLDIDCGCFKQGGEPTSPWVALGRDALIFAALLILLKARPADRSLPEIPAG